MFPSSQNTYSFFNTIGQNAKVNITYNARVTNVNTGSPAAVTYTLGGSTYIEKADYVIMTPSFVQYKEKKITFTPALPTSFNTAMKHLEVIFFFHHEDQIV